MSENTYCGIDITKEHLVVALNNQDDTMTFNNDHKGIYTISGNFRYMSRYLRHRRAGAGDCPRSAQSRLAGHHGQPAQGSTLHPLVGERQDGQQRRQNAGALCP